jgi:hypothetical protein
MRNKSKEKPHIFPDLICITVLLISLSIYFYPFFFPHPKILVTPDIGTSDSWNDGFSKKYILWQSLRSFKLPLWTNSLGNGFPLLGEGQTGVFFPLSWLFALSPSPSISYNLTLFTDVFLFGLGFFVWMRKIGFKHIPSLFSATSLMLSGIIIPQLVHIMHISGLSIMPWIMLLTYLLSINLSLFNIILLAIAFAVQVFAGFPQAVFISAIFSFCYTIFLYLNNNKNKKVFFCYIASLFLVLPLSAIQLIPSYEFLKTTINPNGFDQVTASAYSFPLVHLLTFFNPYYLGNPQNGSYFKNFTGIGSIFWENSGYVGIFPLIFILGILVFRKSDKFKNLQNFFLITLLGSLLLMWGKDSPIYLIYSFWPFDLFRVPSRFIWIFDLCLLGLSTIGLQKIITKFPQKSVRLLIFGLLILQVYHLNTIWHSYHVLYPEKSWLIQPDTLKYIDHDDKTLTYGYESVHNKIFNQNGWTDVNPYFFFRNFLSPNTNSIWNVPSFTVYTGRMIRRPTYMSSLLFSSFNDGENITTPSAITDKFLDINGIKNIISGKLFDSNHLIAVKTLSQNDKSIYIYRNPDPVPLVYVAKSEFVSNILSDTVNIFSSSQFIPNQSVLLDKEINVVDPASGSAKIIKRNNSETEISADIKSKNALLILTDTYYPGWTASIDGKFTQIIPANIHQRSIVVPYGTHHILFKYNPLSFIAGMSISILSWIIVSTILIFQIFTYKRKSSGA